MSSPALSTEPRSLEEILAELREEYGWKYHQFLLMENRSLPLGEIRKMEDLRIECRRLQNRITDLEDEIALRKAKACVPPIFGLAS